MLGSQADIAGRIGGVRLGVKMGGGRQGSKASCVEAGIRSFVEQTKAGAKISSSSSFVTLPLVNTGLGCQAAEHSE